MTTFLENPVWILLAGLGVVGILVVCFFQTGQRAFGIAAVCTLAVFGVLLTWERSVTTDREQLRKTIREMAAAVEANDIERLAQYISPDAPACQNAMRSEMPSYKFDRCQVMKINALEFDRPNNPSKAKLVFFVWADVEAPRYNYKGNVRRRVILFFEKYQGEKWLVTDYDHEDPAGASPYLSEDRLETFEADRSRSVY